MPRNTLIKIRSGIGTPASVDFEVGEPAFNGENLYLKNASGEMVQIGRSVASNYVHSERSRFYILDNNTWVCPIYPGDGYTSGGYGTGSSPDYDLTVDSAVSVPAGTNVKNLLFGGKYSESNLDDIRIQVVKSTATNACWYSGVNETTCESINTVIHDDNWANPASGIAFTGNLEDYHFRKIPINNLVEVDSIVSFYLKPSITGTSNNDYFSALWAFEMVGPTYSTDVSGSYYYTKDEVDDKFSNVITERDFT